MNAWTIVIPWIVLGLLASRWTVGLFMKDACHGSLDDLEEYLLAGAILVATVLAAPLVVPAILICGVFFLFTRTPFWPGICKATKWFYTLDRDKRKGVLR